MENIARIILNKNRGWRGLAELICEDNERRELSKMIFSFSQDMWNDLLRGYIVTQDEDNYIVLQFDNIEALPKPTQQRSVLIKFFIGTVVNKYEYPKANWQSNTPGDHYDLIYHFTKNRNNHTTSDWNCIGIRVVPNI